MKQNPLGLSGLEYDDLDDLDDFDDFECEDVVHLYPVAEGAQAIARATPKSFGYDLSVVGTHIIQAGKTAIIPTGLKLAQALPTNNGGGLAMLILPRSSLPLKHGLIVANAPGLIDADYTGEIGIIVHNISDKAATLEEGMRIAQAIFVYLAFPHVGMSSTPTVRDERGGFGSTGV